MSEDNKETNYEDCLFCGHPHITTSCRPNTFEVCYNGRSRSGHACYFVLCSNCKARGPEYTTTNLAIKAWNTRPWLQAGIAN